MGQNDFFHFPSYHVVAPSFNNSVNPWKNNFILFVEREYYGKEEEELLFKIMSAIGISASEVSIVELEKEADIHLASKISVEERYTIILFGIEASRIGCNLDSKYYKFVHLGEWKILFSHSLNYLATELSAKKALWMALKTEFAPADDA